MESAFRLQPMTRDQLFPAGALATEAYQNDPVLRALPVEAATRDRLLLLYFMSLLGTALAHGAPLVVLHGDTLAGMASSYPAGSYPPPAGHTIKETLRLFFILAREGIPLRSLVNLGRLIWRQSFHHPPGEYNYLELCAVNKAFYRTGIASALIQELEACSKSNQKGVYLETTNPDNLPFYEKLGFQSMATYTIMGIKYWPFWKDP